MNSTCSCCSGELAAEVDQQLAHILVAFIHAGAQQRQDIAYLVQIVALQRGVQHLQLQIEEIQALGNAVVQALRDQAALLGHRQLARLGAQAAVVQRHTQVLAKRFQQLGLGRRHLV